jgi:hypothetical protein
MYRFAYPRLTIRSVLWTYLHHTLWPSCSPPAATSFPINVSWSNRWRSPLYRVVCLASLSHATNTPHLQTCEFIVVLQLSLLLQLVHLSTKASLQSLRASSIHRWSFKSTSLELSLYPISSNMITSRKSFDLQALKTLFKIWHAQIQRAAFYQEFYVCSDFHWCPKADIESISSTDSRRKAFIPSSSMVLLPLHRPITVSFILIESHT